MNTWLHITASILNNLTLYLNCYMNNHPFTLWVLMKTMGNNPYNIVNENSSVSILRWSSVVIVQLVLAKLNLWLHSTIFLLRGNLGHCIDT